jgi:hypothetical protein
VIATDLTLYTILECRRSFLLLELSMIVLDLVIILVLDHNLLKSCSLTLSLNAALAIFMLTTDRKGKLLSYEPSIQLVT